MKKTFYIITSAIYELLVKLGKVFYFLLPILNCVAIVFLSFINNKVLYNDFKAVLTVGSFLIICIIVYFLEKHYDWLNRGKNEYR